METLLEPFQYAFMQKAFLVSLLIAVPMALLSCFLVLKGWALMGDAISHSVLPGIVLAYIAGIPLAIGAFAAGMFCAVSTGYLTENSRVREDTIMGVVFSGMFGLGVVMYRKIETEVHLDHILFGDLLGISQVDLLQSLIIGVITAVIITLRRRDFLLNIFDSQHARAIGMPTKILHYGLLVLISLSIVSALKAVGLILSIAMLVAPGTIAYLLTDRFDAMLAYAVAIASVSSLAGVYASFHIGSAPAPTIVLLMTFIFIVVFIVTTARTRNIRHRNRNPL